MATENINEEKAKDRLLELYQKSIKYPSEITREYDSTPEKL